MTALTLDHLSGGRFILGLGASGPQVVEGWYGQPYPKPLARTREYVEIVRRVLAREEPVDFQGEHYQLPNLGRRHHGPRQAAQVDHPPAAGRPPDLPRRRGPEERGHGRRDRRRLAADLPVAELDAHYRECLAEGFARPGARRTARRLRDPQHGPDHHRRRRRARPPTSSACRSASTSAAWAPRRSTSTPTCSPAWATATRSRDPGPVPRRPQGRGHRAGAARAGGGRRPRRPEDKIREELDERGARPA